MNLYEITIGHAAPKDWRLSMLGYVLAENDEQVYEYIKSEPEINGYSTYNGWADSEDLKEEYEIYDKSFEVIGKETFKEKIIRLKGEINDDSYDFSNSYYGITLFGWELICENVENMDGAISAGIVHKINKP